MTIYELHMKQFNSYVESGSECVDLRPCVWSVLDAWQIYNNNDKKGTAKCRQIQSSKN